MARAARRYPQRSDPELYPELIDVLLLGWSAPIRPEHFESNPFRIFELDDAELRNRWQKHRSALLAEAGRRGITRPWAQQQFED